MSFYCLLAAASTTTTQGTPPPWYDFIHNPMFPLILIVAIFYIFMFRSKKGQDKEREKNLKEMKRGDRVQTIGGILGTIVEARDTDVVVKVDEGNNTKIKFARSAIHRILEEDKAAVK